MAKRLAFFSVVLIVAVLWAVGQGAASFSSAEVFAGLFSAEPSSAQFVIWQLRLPRICLALLTGASLAACGVALQGLFRNPLADSGLLGISSGAAVAAVATIVLFGGASLLLISVSAVAGAALVLVLLLALSRFSYDSNRILLAGVALNATIGAAISGLSVVASETELRSATFWMLGSVGRADWSAIALAALLVPVAIVLLLRHSRELDALCIGEADAWSMGVDVTALRYRIIILTAVLTGLSVALCGVIGFVGLIVPHLVRLWLGPAHKQLMVFSVIGGGLLLLLADTLCRTIVAPAELPVGVLSALLGGPFFMAMLLRRGAVK